MTSAVMDGVVCALDGTAEAPDASAAELNLVAEVFDEADETLDRKGAATVTVGFSTVAAVVGGG